jgi:hypothetical protein
MNKLCKAKHWLGDPVCAALFQTYTTSHEEYKWKRVLDEIIDGVDLCLNGNEYGICNPRRFPTCEEGTRICLYRQPRTDLFYDRLHHDPAYYIDYNKIQCVPHWNDEKGRKWNCNLCDPGGTYTLLFGDPDRLQ